jgi:hypothetical protein
MSCTLYYFKVYWNIIKLKTKEIMKKNKLIIQIIVTAIILLFVGMAALKAQTFDSDLPDDFESVSFQVDPFGSINKQGLNAMVSFSVIDFGWAEYEIQSQFIINEENYTSGLTYIDLYLGFGAMIPLGTSTTITPGIHLGGIYRPANVVYNNPNYNGWTGGISYGLTGKFRQWLSKSKRIAIIISGSYDRRPDIEGTPFIINGRGGIEIRLN